MNADVANALIAGGFLTFAAWAIRRSLRGRHHLPAAPDNIRGVDPDLLWECRRIANTDTARKEDR